MNRYTKLLAFVLLNLFIQNIFGEDVITGRSLLLKKHKLIHTKPFQLNNSYSVKRDLEGFPDPIVTLHAGALLAFVNNNATLAVNTGNTTGTTIQLRKDLGFKQQEYYPKADLFIRLAKRHQIVLSFLYMRQNRTKSLSRDIEYDGSVYHAYASVTTKSQIYMYSAEYRFSVVRKPRWEVGLLLGGKFFQIQTSLKANLGDSSYTNSKTWYAPVPMPGVHGSYTFGQRVTLRGSVEYFTLRFNNYNFQTITINPTVEFYIVKNVGLGAAYQYFFTEIKKDPLGTFNGSIKYSYNGVSLFVCARI
jgi:hypothetical protein